MNGLVEFLHNEQLQSETDPIIIAHGGYLHDFPILLTSCMKYNFHDFRILTECMFTDSMEILQHGGCRRPGLDTLCQELDIKRNSHSALGDAYILKTVCNKKSELLDHLYGYTFKDIVSHLNGKLPIPIQKVFDLALKCSSYTELESILIPFVKKKTALNINQLCKIAYWYYEDRYLHCK